jgi:ATP-dependent Clp protease ATP-binding subunit ClpA
MFERFSTGARSAVRCAVDEAARRGDRRVGTEHMLLGLLAAPVGEIADALGIDLARARTELAAMDAQALASVGVDVPDALGALPLGRGTQRLPFTAGAREVLAGSLRIAAVDRGRRIEPRHVLLALLGRPAPDPAAVLMARLGIDPVVVRQRLADVA